MKNIFKKIIETLLKWEAGAVLRKYKPKIIAVTGTVGKTSVKNAIAIVLSQKFNVRQSEKSYNSEFGAPLTILGEKSGWSNPFKWLMVLSRGALLPFKREKYPEILVLEMGVDRPLDMEKMISWIKPDIAVLTAIGEVPVHIENFKNVEELAKEKIKLVYSLDIGDYAVINGDDKIISEAKDKIKSNVISYGFSDTGENKKGLDIMASDYHIVSRDEDGRQIPEGITFKITYGGSIIPVRLYDVYGKQGIYAVLPALSVGLSLGLNLMEMIQSLANYRTSPGRLKLLNGIKNSYILDDTYNASPIAMQEALSVLKDIPAKRKIAVLGDMLELGKYTIDEHKKIGKLAGEIADIVITVGSRSKFIAEEALNNDLKKDSVFEFEISDEAKISLQDMMREGDLILIKGSQSMRMEKIVEEIMAEPERKEELLVRQEEEWKDK